jgi:pimeloyl-ACP methyl ester carboxylesterase
MQLAYTKLGIGHPLFILHGLYGSGDNWITVGRKLSETFEVYLVDLRNHGRSPHSDVHTYEAMAEDIKELLDSLGIEKASIIGHSMGGKVAMFFAAKYKGLLSNLIIVDIAPKTYTEEERNAKEITNHRTILEAMASADLKSAKTRDEVENSLKLQIGSDRVRQFIMKNVKRSKDNQFFWALNINALKQNLAGILAGLDIESFKLSGGVKSFPVLFIKGGRSNYIMDEDLADMKIIFPYSQLMPNNQNNSIRLLWILFFRKLELVFC